MRPIRLELEGFTAFRQLTAVNFAEADLFALAGPTGAGKTSLIDAITFALYGAVPRLDRRAVAPIVSQNLTEARVRLDFAVASQTYTAVRVVRATKSGGATTKEARLERTAGPPGPAATDQDGQDSQSGTTTGTEVLEVLAGNADEVTNAVTELLGLTYDHFITCVSLPQGQFARFLHDKPRDRQDLLVRLLGLGVYEQVASLARQRSTLAKGHVDVLEGQLARLAGATPEARTDAEARVAELTSLASKLTEARADLDKLAEKTAVALRSADQAIAQLQLLDGLEAPGDVAELAEAIASTTAERAQLAEAEEATAEAITAAESALAELPVRQQLEALQRDLVGHDELAKVQEKGQQAASDAEQAVEEAATAETIAETGRRAAAEALERVRVAQRAQALVPQLQVGEPCPVCQQTVHSLPDVTSPEVSGAEAALAEAERALKAAARKHSDARTHQARVDEKLARVERDLDEVSERLAAATNLTGPGKELVEMAARAAERRDPDRDRDQEAEGAGTDQMDLLLDKVDNALRQVAEAEQAVTSAQQADRDVRKQRSSLETRHERLVKQETKARRAFDAARDRLAVLQPPAFERENLADDWARLIQWAEGQRPNLEAEAERHRKLAGEAQREHLRRWDELAELCRSAGIEPPESHGAEGVPSVDGLTEAVAVARARAEDTMRRIETDMAEAEQLRRQQTDATERSQVADLLAEHLKANRFEKWLLDEAVGSLAAGASSILEDLSAGAYALSVDPRNGGFTVIDHANASQPRPARTLSGGETFLASLALALALADQVAELATGGTARLDALFLDEGFGTLDAETLDVVAAALDELGARGRMVGIVTHVRELAERLPVRFEVRKVGANAAVERVEAA